MPSFSATAVAVALTGPRGVRRGAGRGGVEPDPLFQ